MADFADLHARFDQFEAKFAAQLGVMFRAIKLIAKDHATMTKLTDDIGAIADEILNDIDTVAGYSGASDDSLVALKTKFSTGRDKLKQIIADHDKAHAGDSSTSAGDADPVPVRVVPPVPSPLATAVPGTAPVVPVAGAPAAAADGSTMILADGTKA